MEKFYRVIKENFLWEVGAVLKSKEMKSGKIGYTPVDSIFRVSEFDRGECISANIVENSPEYFERVYQVNLATSVVYKLKEEAKAILKKEYRG